MYGPPRMRLQAIEAFVDSSSLSEMSPDAPGRTAMIGWIGRLPLATYARSLPSTGVGIVTSDFFASRHSSAPVAGSYPRAYCAALVTTSVRTPFRQTTGELHDGISSRGVDQTFDPSARSNAAMNESWLRSHWRMHLPSYRTGELPNPHSYSRSMAKLESSVLRSRFQRRLPAKS